MLGGFSSDEYLGPSYLIWLQSFLKRKACACSINIHPSEHVIATGQVAGFKTKPHIQIWNYDTLQLLHTVGSGHISRAVSCVAFSASNRSEIVRIYIATLSKFDRTYFFSSDYLICKLYSYSVVLSELLDRMHFHVIRFDFDLCFFHIFMCIIF